MSDDIKKPKSLEKKVSALSQILAATAQEDNALGFMAREFILANLPHSNPNKDIWIRENGNYSLMIESSTLKIEGKTVIPGIPYGSRARLILLWLISEAKKNNTNCVSLGKSFAEFLKSINLHNKGGKRGDRTSVEEQIKRILSCKFSFAYSDAENSKGKQFLLSEAYDLWWDDVSEENSKNIIPFNKKDKESYIVLSTQFFEAIKNSAVPVDVRVLNELSQSPLAMDLYCWLTYRIHGLKTPVRLTWYMLQEQFGADYKNIHDFAKKIKSSIEMVKKYYSDLDVDFVRGGIILNPSGSHIKNIT